MLRNIPEDQRHRLKLRRRIHWATLHATRQGVNSPAIEAAASKLATPIIGRKENAGLSLLSSFGISEMN